MKRALLSETVSSFSTRDGVIAPDILISTAGPVKENEEVRGVAMGAVAVDNAFVDGVNRATGLNSAIFSGDKISATTLTAEDGITRRLGIAESNSHVTETVLAKGETFTGSINFLNTPYFASYMPIRDIDETPIGMLFVGKPQVTVLATAGRSIQASFAVAGILWLAAILPSYLIASYISKQVS